MFDTSETPGAFWRTHRMAGAAGVDLPRAVVDGWLERRELAELLSQCSACALDSACRPEPPLPALCPNRARIEALRP